MIDIEKEILFEYEEYENLISGIDEDNITISKVESMKKIEKRTFTKISGPIEIDVNIISPADFFELFFTKEIVKDIVNQSNLYQKQELAKISKIDKFQEITIEEIYGFFSAHILIKIIRLPSYRDYFTSDILESSIKEIISRDVFEKVSKYKHLFDNTKYDKTPLYKIKPLLSIITKFPK